MQKTSIPFQFVLDHLEPRRPQVRPMFGCHAVYIGDKLVLVLRKGKEHTSDNGVWLATTREHHNSLKEIFPRMRTIRLFGSKTSSWQNLPDSADDFEESVRTACTLILRNDPRIGRISKGQ